MLSALCDGIENKKRVIVREMERREATALVLPPVYDRKLAGEFRQRLKKAEESDVLGTVWDYVKKVEPHTLVIHFYKNSVLSLLGRIWKRTDIDPADKQVDINDARILSLVNDAKELGINDADLWGNIHGRAGIPELEGEVFSKLNQSVRPKDTEEFTALTALALIPELWVNYAEKEVNDGKELSDIVIFREDLYQRLLGSGLDHTDAFKIMEFVRSGRALGREYHGSDFKKNVEMWAGYRRILEEKQVPEELIGLCEKIRYMFPRDSARVYASDFLRLLWYKFYRREAFYEAWVVEHYEDIDNCSDDISEAAKGEFYVKTWFYEHCDKDSEFSSKLPVMRVMQEMQLRDYEVTEWIDAN